MFFTRLFKKKEPGKNCAQLDYCIKKMKENKKNLKNKDSDWFYSESNVLFPRIKIQALEKEFDIIIKKLEKMRQIELKPGSFERQKKDKRMSDTPRTFVIMRDAAGDYVD